MYKAGDEVYILHKDAMYGAKVATCYVCQATGEHLYVVYVSEFGYLIRKDSHVYEMCLS